MIWLFGAAIFLSAGLVFLVQPMTAKLLLPTFGGSPQVWTAAMVFFQGALLAGYAYAHLSVRRLGMGRQPAIHGLLLLLPLAVLPVGLRGLEQAGQLPPAVAVVAILAASVGAPYVAVTATSPLLQRWFAATGHHAAADPYFLYAAGNVGSLLGLLSYPLIIEPRLSLGAQGVLWSAGYVGFVVLCVGCVLVLRQRALPAASEPEVTPSVTPHRPITWPRRLGWVVRAFIPSSLMLGVTTYSSTDIAAVPLLWAIPLSIYLLTFVLAFSRRRPLSTAMWANVLPFTTIAVVLTIIGIVELPIWARLLVHYVGFFVAAMVAHGQLADDRPGTDHLTQFYLLLSLGGVLGGIFNALVAPAAFDAVIEYPLVLVLALLLRRGWGSTGSPAAMTRQRFLDLVVPLVALLGLLATLVVLTRAAPEPAAAGRVVVAVAAIAALVTLRRPLRFGLLVAAVLAITVTAGQASLFADRTFFGLNRVIDDGAGHRIFLSGSTIHGVERTDPGGGRLPLSYYHPTGPAGQIFQSLPAGLTATGSTVGEPEIAIIGLGAGGLAAYGKPGQHVTFVEIDPVVIRIARDPKLFRFVTQSPARIDIAEADGRLWLADRPDGSFDLIVLDAFSSDSVPAHLLTREAIEMYASKLRPGGRLMFNTTNTYLDVRSVVVGGARQLGLTGYSRHDSDLTVAPPGDKEVSEFVVLAHDPAPLEDLEADARWTSIETVQHTVVWTDDFSDVLGVIK